MATFGQGLVLLFGGTGSSGLLADSWVWNGAVWTPADVAGPSARRGHAMATLGSEVVLFGGGNGKEAFGDTWIWDGKRWTKSSAAGPSARCGHAMATLNDTVVLFGGLAGDCSNPANGPLGDTWVFDGTSWTEASSTGPRPRYELAMAPQGDTVLLTGGTTDGNSFLGDAWIWSGTAWSAPPQTSGGGIATYGLAMASFQGLVVVFGGTDGQDVFGQTWLWSGAGWQQGADAPASCTVYATAMATW
jgi:hypothetical protein